MSSESVDPHPEFLALSRRDFLALSAAAAAAAAAGCATNPVSGRQQFMLVTEDMEKSLDRQWAPHQFSADYGASLDRGLNDYVTSVGKAMVPLSHRPKMPFNFRAVNAVAVNGYTFPAGSVALTRGLMLNMKSESELAAVLGHEIGHVSWKHAGERMSKNLLATAVITGATIYMQYEHEKYADVAAGLGSVGAGMLLCKYSRDDEREADELGMEYMVRAGYNPQGMADVMQTFRELEKSRPSSVDTLFSTHPMSEERYRTAVNRIGGKYGDTAGRSAGRERYMDSTAPLRSIGDAIQAMQDGEGAMAKKKFGQAETFFGAALKKAPFDYAGLLMMSKCCLAQKKFPVAADYAEKARRVYPDEPQALHVLGMAKAGKGDYDSGLACFSEYERKLPGNANTAYFTALCLDRSGRKQEAAREYMRYRQNAPGGEYAAQTERRLLQWGYLRPAPQPQTQQR